MKFYLIFICHSIYSCPVLTHTKKARESNLCEATFFVVRLINTFCSYFLDPNLHYILGIFGCYFIAMREIYLSAIYYLYLDRK